MNGGLFIHHGGRKMYTMLPEEMMASIVGTVVMIAVILICVFYTPREKK